MNEATLNYEEVLKKLHYLLEKTNAEDALTLLKKAEEKTKRDDKYAKEMRKVLLKGSSVELRELLSCFGNWLYDPPPYNHRNAVNAWDSAMAHVQKHEVELALEFYNFRNDIAPIQNEERLDLWFRGELFNPDLLPKIDVCHIPCSEHPTREAHESAPYYDSQQLDTGDSMYQWEFFQVGSSRVYGYCGLNHIRRNLTQTERISLNGYALVPVEN